jgi:hypothetical protein
MAYEVLEGTWEDLSRLADRFAGRRLRVTILEENGMSGRPGCGRPIRFGMFGGAPQPCEDDFRSAEFHGDPDDGLPWP